MPPRKYPNLEPEGDELDDAEDLLTTPAADRPLTPDLKPPTSFNPEEQLAQLLKLMQSYAGSGLVQQRPDGSFLFPGQSDTRWEERLAIGSTCTCAACTPHNQRHWICMVCHSSHEWVLVQDRPRTMKTQLGQGGVAGFVHLVCSNECALEYRRRAGMGDAGVMVPGMDRQVPVAGGDDDPMGFFSTR